MIFDLVEKDDGVILVSTQKTSEEIWDLVHLMEGCGMWKNNYSVACYGDYENAIIMPKD